MTLDDAQRKKVGEWISQGLKLSEIQNRIISEFKLRPTYMDVRLLVDDLKLTPKDQEQSKAPESPLQAGGSLPANPPNPRAGGDKPGLSPASTGGAGAPSTGGVSVTVDQITRAGAVVSGRVKFSDGNSAEWYIDQTGRLGLAPSVAGYRPPAADVQQFQAALEVELQKLGF